MEGSEGTSQELYAGWSSLVHQPCEDLEESDLPSTVDIAAFSSGLNVDPANSSGQTLNADSDSDSEADSSNSGSEASHSGSQSDSSESDSSTSSQESTSRSSSPAEFSVTTSQTGGGLRLTIATVKKNSASPPPPSPTPSTSNSPEKAKISCQNNDVSRGANIIINRQLQLQQIRNDRSTKLVDHSSGEEEEREEEEDRRVGGNNNGSDRAGPARGVANNETIRRSHARKARVVKSTTTTSGGGSGSSGGTTVKSNETSSSSRTRGKTRGNNRKMSSLSSQQPTSVVGGGAPYLNDDNAANMLTASCGSLEVIRDEDLAAILPDQRSLLSTRSGPGGVGVVDASDAATAAASDSDMELSHQAVDALIQRTTESSSESDGEMANPPALYANSLLQQFEAQTQMLSTQLANAPNDKKTQNPQNSNVLTEEKTHNDTSKSKRRRGRPKRTNSSSSSSVSKKKAQSNNAYSISPNVSPDSGIQNSPDHVSSPEPSSNVKKDEDKKKSKEAPSTKLSVDSLSRHFYGNSERTLYPPKKKPTRVSARKENMVRNNKRKEDERRKCNNNNNSKDSEKKQQNENDKVKSNNVNNNNSSENGGGKRSKSSFLFEICERVSKRLEMAGKNGQKQSMSNHNNNNNGKIQKQATNTNINNKQNNNNNSGVGKSCNNHRNNNKRKNNAVETAKRTAPTTTLKTAKVMHSKRRRNHGDVTHKKRKFKILKPLTYVARDPKINVEIEKLTCDFTRLCLANNKTGAGTDTGTAPKPNNNNNNNIVVTGGETLKNVKRVSKKRKTNEYERKKKKQQQQTDDNVEKNEENANNNEQRLPLKKRHYHVTTTTTTMTAEDDEDHVDEAIEACINRFNESSPIGRTNVDSTSPAPNKTTTTPKKRHRLIENEESRGGAATATDGDETKTDAQMVTRKKNRLEDLTSNLASKMNTTEESKRKGETSSVSVKYPACKKTKPTELERLDDITSPKPTGIFMPTVDIEMDLVGKDEKILPSNNDDDQKRRKAKRGEEDEEKTKVMTASAVGGAAVNASGETGKKKVRKRRAPNRTGFPTVKKKKKKKEDVKSTSCVEAGTEGKREGAELKEVGVATVKTPKACDRVPVDGEEYESFVNRTENGASYTDAHHVKRPSKQQHQRPPTTQQKNHHDFDDVDDKNKPTATTSSTTPTPSYDDASAYDSSSDCDSLPQDERTECDLEEFQLRPDVQSPATSIDDVEKRRCLGGDATDSSTLDEAPPTTKRRGFNKLREDDAASAPTLLGRGHRKRKSRGGDAEEPAKTSASNERAKRRLMRTRKSGDDTKVERRRGSKERASSISTTVSTTSSTNVVLAEERGKKGGGGAKAPRWKKRYLVAGLFSDYYKEDDETIRRKRQDPTLSSSSSSSSSSTSSSSSKTLVYVPSEHPYGLLPPPYHCGRYLRQRRVHFQLPYDVHHAATSVSASSANHSSSSSSTAAHQQRNQHSVPSWNYRKIRTNVYNVSRGERGNGGGGAYHSSSAAAAACEQQQCNCKEGAGCGEDCINRLVLSECPSANGAHRCDNQRIQRHEWAPGLEKFMTEEKGWGVRTKSPIKSNDFILEYVGEVVSDQEFKERMGDVYANDTHHYCLHLDAGLVIDGHRMGGNGRFVNHSCEPNCEMQKWSVNGQYRMALFALRDIEGGEELTYDYNFSLFDPAVGQECKCGSDMCRGVIGGKSQRVRQPNDNKSGAGAATTHAVGRVGRPRKVVSTSIKKSDRNVNDTKTNNNQQQQNNGANQNRRGGATCGDNHHHLQHFQQHLQQQAVAIQVKPITEQQKIFVREHRCFLIRNIDKVRKVKDRAVGISFVNRPNTTTSSSSSVATSTSDRLGGPSAFLNHLNALQKPRNMKTRRIAQAEDDPDLNRSIRLASILKDVYDAVVNFNDENGPEPSAPFQNLPTKRKHPEFHRQNVDPLDFATIERRIANGSYNDYATFDADVDRVLRTFTRFYGASSEQAVAALRLRAVYGDARRVALERLEKAEQQEKEEEKESEPSDATKVGGASTCPATNVAKKLKKEEEEDIIRCICGMYHDEGLMIQCERCLVWQHCECVRADATAPSYHCEKCSPRPVDHEIPMDEFTEHGHRYYLTLMRGDLQLRQGDTVYVLRDIPIPGTDQKHTYKTIGEKPDYNDLDIFRIERLWKDSKTGQRLAYGHHYLRPHETYHEPTRKFFPNEVMRVPLYEAVPVELIISQCWVLDLNTYCKGRPVGADERHVYICEYRVDKSARLFYKVSHKARYPVCTKSYVFERFPERMRASRTYTPHEIEGGGAAKNNATNSADATTTNGKVKGAESSHKRGGGVSGDVVKGNGKRGDESNVVVGRGARTTRMEREGASVSAPKRRNSNEQKSRLNKILLNLLSRLPTKQILDVSYLLEGGRRRKNKLMKTNGSNNNNNVNQ